MTPHRRQLRVLMTADVVGGVWNHALTLCGALARHEVAVCLATIGPPPSSEQRAAGGLSNVELVSVDARLEWMPDAGPDLPRVGQWLQDVASAWHPDILHLNGYAHAGLPWQMPVVVAAHSCVLSWWRAVKGTDAPADWNLYRTVVRRGIHAADIVVAPTQAMLEALALDHGRPAECHVVPNGIAAIRHNGGKEPIVLSAGRLWDEAKNVATLDAAARHVSWPVLVAGDAKHPAGGLVSLRHARALGQIPPAALRAWQQRAAIFAAAAHYEPFGLAALEAARARCALVLGDIASQRELWGDAALFVPPSDSRALAEAIEALIDDPERRRTMAARAQRRASRFTARRMADRYYALYASLRARGPRRRLAAAA